MSNVKEEVKLYILSELIPNHPITITEKTSLIKEKVIDSMKTLMLVDFLEKKFQIQFKSFELDPDYLDNLLLIEETVKSKLK